MDDLQGERQQEEAHLAQVRADALAEETANGAGAAGLGS